jgi:hypothetical protein
MRSLVCLAWGFLQMTDAIDEHLTSADTSIMFDLVFCVALL